MLVSTHGLHRPDTSSTRKRVGQLRTHAHSLARRACISAPFSGFLKPPALSVVTDLPADGSKMLERETSLDECR